MSLTTQQYHQLLDDLYTSIEDQLDASELDVDIDNNGNLLTIELEDDSQLILSRQEPLHQLWLAARSGGYHFNYDQQQNLWLCDNSGDSLQQILSQQLSQHSDSTITLL